MDLQELEKRVDALEQNHNEIMEMFNFIIERSQLIKRFTDLT